MSDTTFTVTTGDGWSKCCCSMHMAAPAISIAPWYRVLVQETSVIVRGLSLEVKA